MLWWVATGCVPKKIIYINKWWAVFGPHTIVHQPWQQTVSLESGNCIYLLCCHTESSEGYIIKRSLGEDRLRIEMNGCLQKTLTFEVILKSMQSTNDLCY